MNSRKRSSSPGFAGALSTPTRTAGNVTRAGRGGGGRSRERETEARRECFAENKKETGFAHLRLDERADETSRKRAEEVASPRGENPGSGREWAPGKGTLQ
ncbi:hypothetical protein ACHAWF_000008, partial [Thalassiosira exigua]